MVGDSDEVLVNLCTATRMGRGRVIAAALEFFMNAYVGMAGPTPQQIVERLIKERDMPSTIKDATELAKIQVAMKAVEEQHSLGYGQLPHSSACDVGSEP